MSQGKEFGRMAGERQQQLSYIPQQQQTTNCINYNATAAQVHALVMHTDYDASFSSPV